MTQAARLARGEEELLAGEARWLLDRIGRLAGARVVELCCGVPGYLDALALRVGPTGTVVGVERDADAAAAAHRLVRRRGFRNVELVHGDAGDTKLPAGTFDLVAARLVRVEFPGPEEIIAEAVRLARPGGIVAFFEADLLVGRRLSRLLRDAGLVHIRVRPFVQAWAHKPA